MREFAKVGPKFWNGETGKALRRRGSEAVVMAWYLMTSPHSNMLGLYSQPMLYAAHETGLGVEGASLGLRHCIEVGFCAYDEDSEMVWVFKMAKYQIADALLSTDKRCKGIQKDYDSLSACPFLGPFFDRYQHAFHLTRRRDGNLAPALPVEGAYQAPPKQREGEREGERERGIEGSSAKAAASERLGDTPPLETSGHSPTLAGAICKAIRHRAKFAEVNPGDIRFKTLVDQGVTEDEFVGVATEAVDGGKGWAWILKVVESRRNDAARINVKPAAKAVDPFEGAR